MRPTQICTLLPSGRPATFTANSCVAPAIVIPSRGLTRVTPILGDAGTCTRVVVGALSGVAVAGARVRCGTGVEVTRREPISSGSGSSGGTGVLVGRLVGDAARLKAGSVAVGALSGTPPEAVVSRGAASLREVDATHSVPKSSSTESTATSGPIGPTRGSLRRP